MRRRTLLTTLTTGAVGLAGCSLPSTEPSTNTTTDATGASPSTATSQPPATQTTASETPGDDSDAAALLEFDTAIDATTRERCRRALDRTMAMAGATLTAPVQVVQVTPRMRQGASLPAAYGSVLLNAPTADARPPRDVTVPGALGHYDPSERTLSLADPAAVPDTVFGETDEAPTISFADFPNDPFLAHELAHAVQYDATTVAALPDGTDGRTARQGVTEGTADYVQGRYRRACAGGEYDPCRARGSFPSAPAVPLWLVPRRLPYVDGTAFAHAAVERGGWDLLWEQHRSPPATTQAIMFPDMHFADEITVESLDPHPEVDGWNRIRDGRLGVGPLYLKLRAHDIASATHESAAVPDPLTDATGLEYVFRHDLLRDWRGDQRTTYVNDRNRALVHWRTRWASEDTARRIERGVADDYGATDSVGDQMWEVGRGIVTVERDGQTVTFGRAPSVEAKEAVLDAV